MTIMLKSFFLFCIFSIGIIGTAYSANKNLQVDVIDTSRQQGEFFIVKLTHSPERPTLQFLEHPYRMFRQSDGSWRALVPIENLTLPGNYNMIIHAGETEESIPVTVRANNRAIQSITLSPSKAELRATESEKSRIKSALQTESPEKLFDGHFLRPSDGATSSLFGLKRSYNGGPVESYHKGIDIAAPEGTPVKSTAKGVVILTGTVEEGFHVNGNTVIIDHGQGLISIYLHLSTITVKEGKTLEAGSVIGTVGQTGISTAPHLHWGTYLYGTSVNPELFEGNSF